MCHFDVKTMCLQDAEAPLILDGLAQAERYSKDKVAASPELGCHAYNRDGAIVETSPTRKFMSASTANPPPNGIFGWVARVWLLEWRSSVWMCGGLQPYLWSISRSAILMDSAVKLIDGMAGLEHNKK